MTSVYAAWMLDPCVNFVLCSGRVIHMLHEGLTAFTRTSGRNQSFDRPFTASQALWMCDWLDGWMRLDTDQEMLLIKQGPCEYITRASTASLVNLRATKQLINGLLSWNVKIGHFLCCEQTLQFIPLWLDDLAIICQEHHSAVLITCP